MIATLSSPRFIGLLVVALALILILVSAGLGIKIRRRTPPSKPLPGSQPTVSDRLYTITGLRELPALTRLRRSVGLAVEAGQRLHVTLGSGGLIGFRAGSALVGLGLLQRIARAASISDRPPVATSGDGSLGILSQDTLRSSMQKIGIDRPPDPFAGQVTGLTPFSYAAGAIPLVLDQNISATVMAGHFASEAALISDAAERAGSLSLGGSDNLAGQAVLVGSAQEPLIGEELYVSGAYLQASLIHLASLRAQDALRWALVVVILLGVVLKLIGLI